MKKVEAMELAPARSRLLMEYIYQILLDTNKVNALIYISYTRVDKEDYVTYEIYVPNNGFEKHLNTGITVQQRDVLTEQIFVDLIDFFLKSDTMGISDFITVRGGRKDDFDGIYAFNINGSKIKIDFGGGRNPEFSRQVKEYNNKIEEYRVTVEQKIK